MKTEGLAMTVRIAVILGLALAAAGCGEGSSSSPAKFEMNRRPVRDPDVPASGARAEPVVKQDSQDAKPKASADAAKP